MLLFPAEYDLLDASVVLPGLVKQKSSVVCGFRRGASGAVDAPASYAPGGRARGGEQFS